MNKTALYVGIIILLIVGVGAYWVTTRPDTVDNESGSVDVNQAPVTSGENPEPGSQVHDLPVEPAAAAVRRDLAAKLSVEERSIVILQITEVEWTDGCLGLGGAAESCLQALVPGFRVEMLAQGETYVYRTDKTGETIRAEME